MFCMIIKVGSDIPMIYRRRDENRAQMAQGPLRAKCGPGTCAQLQSKAEVFDGIGKQAAVSNN